MSPREFWAMTYWQFTVLSNHHMRKAQKSGQVPLSQNDLAELEQLYADALDSGMN